MSSPSTAGYASASRVRVEAQEHHDDASSVIMSPGAVDSNELIDTPIGKHERTAEDETIKQSPHFAQPTKSFARRAGETLRREASSSPTKSFRDSPPKSIKAGDPHSETGTRRAPRQLKRTSLPGDWLGGAGQQAADNATAASLGAQKSPKRHSTASVLTADTHQESTQSTSSDTVNKAAQQAAPARKKVSSYMAPTTATTQRTAGTIRKEKPKQSSPSPKKLNKKDLTIDTRSVAQERSSRTSETATALSDTSSVQFILDRPRVSTPSPHKGGSTATKGTGRQSPAGGSPRSKDGRRSRFGSPTKLPRAFKRTDSSFEDTGSIPEAASLARPMPDVANTTTVRRTSNSQILRPILERLSAQGLTRDRASSIQSMISAADSAGLSNALSMAREQVPEKSKGSEDKPEMVNKARATGPVPQPLPPHLRTRKNARPSSEDSPLEVPTAGFPLQDLSASSLPTNTMPKNPRASSLRATASEFTPSTYVDQTSEQYIAPSLHDLTAFRNAEEWSAIPGETKRAILQLRQLQNNLRPALTLPSRVHPPRDSDDSAWQSANVAAYQPHRTLGATTAVDENGSPHTVQPGQVLKPNLSPGKKTVHWTLQDLDGTETSIKFGRAAAPPAPPGLVSPGPTISPRSDDTSPLDTPQRGWSIGSAASPNPYGWKGGDGKEIRFVGYGPYAERDPNSVVNFDFQGRSNSAWGLGENKENVARVAPRSQKQWAEKMGYPKVPCGNAVVQTASEMIPFGSQLAGYCFDCYADR